MKKSRAENPRLRESDVVPQIVQALEASGTILFRNNVGVAKYGPHWVRFGVGGNGGSDHIGYLPVRITKEMVGHYVAVFVAAESKRPLGARYDDKQIEFLENVRAAGGIAGFTHSWEEASALVSGWFQKFINSPSKKVEKKIKKA